MMTDLYQVRVARGFPPRLRQTSVTVSPARSGCLFR